MTYNIQDHGDVLERAAVQLIREKFVQYELVWQLYIGNKGTNMIAELPNYPDEEKRKNFAENSYTTLESVFIVDKILKSKVFEKQVTNFIDYIEFNKAFLSVFALLGRMHDTVIKASDLLKYDNTNFKESIHEFYEARSIVIHGKKVPLIFDDLGFLKIPFLKTKTITGIAWEDKHCLWDEVHNMDKEYVADTLTNFFDELLLLINNEYSVFYHIIKEELKSINSQLLFTFRRIEIVDEDYSRFPDSSGSTTIFPVDVYGFNRNKKNT